jgi:hypothetical protein
VGSGPSGVTLSIDSVFFLDLNTPGDSTGIAYFSIGAPDLGYFHTENLQTEGSLGFTKNSGPLTFPKCPCVLEIDGAAAVNVSSGASGTAQDPFTINLPPGWTYTLASQEIAATAEPRGQFLIGSVLAMVCIFLLRRPRLLT